MKISKLFIAIGLLLILNACSPIPAPDSIFSALETVSAAPSFVPPLSTPTLLSTNAAHMFTPPAKSPFPPAAIEILAPVSDQSYSSPLNLMVRVHPSNTDLLQISLFGNKGQLLARRILPPASIDAQEIMLTSLYFEISAASEEAHLQISSKDKYGRLLALSSVPLILLANPLEQAAALPIPKFDEIIWIQSPELNSEVESGEILITGIVWSSSPRPLLAQLISRSGKVLAFGEIYPQALEDQAYSNFEITFDLILDEVQWLQIGISEHSRELAGMLHYSSLEFQLVP